MRGEIVERGPDYERLEHNSIEVLNRLLEASIKGERVTKGLLAVAKTAQSGLASVQSHRKTRVASRALDYTMARSLTNDPAQLTEYIRLTQHDSALVEALPAGGAK